MNGFSSQVLFQRHILPILEKHGKEIGVRSKEGDENCSSIIRLYMLLYGMCDPVTLYTLEATLQKAGYYVPPYFEDEF